MIQSIPFLVVCVAILLCATGYAENRPPAAEVSAATASVTDIQAAVDELRGDGIVRVPAGRVQAIGTIHITGGVSLIGAGRDETVLFRGPDNSDKPTAPIVEIQGANGKASQIVGINFVGLQDPASKTSDNGITVLDAKGFRIAHCRFERFGFSAVYVRGNCRGVIDHCLFANNFKKPINNLGYGVVVYGAGEWRDDLQPGSADSVFIEDSEFIGSRHAVASNGGARYVFRHNRVHGNDNSQAVDCHGPGYGSKHGTQWIEVYDNLIEKPIGGSTAMVLRGGGGVVFDNTIKDYARGINLTLDFDKRIDWTRPYPIPEQIQNMWCWNNTLKGEATVPVISKRSAEHIKPDRDYFSRPMPDYTPFRYPHPLAAQE